MPVSPQHNERRRSVGFLEHEGRNWSCFLVTYPAEGGGWQGHFTFRPADAETEADEIRTSDIFLETGDAEVQARARGLGRPLLRATSDGLTVAIDARGRIKAGLPPRQSGVLVVDVWPRSSVTPALGVGNGLAIAAALTIALLGLRERP